jgi:hypothetical protein
MLRVDPLGMLAFVAAGMCGFLSILLFRSGARGSVARKLALLLVVEGTALATSGSIDLLFTGIAGFYARHPRFALAELLLHALADCGMLILYPPFLAAALQTRLVRPFAGGRVRIVIAGVVGLLYVALTWPVWVAFIDSTTPDYRLLAGPAAVLYIALVALFVFAFVASVRAWQAASGAARKRARIFAVAFGIRDVCWGSIYAVMVWELWVRNFAAVFGETPAWFFVYALGTFIAVPLIAYGILRTQLFDLDLRIRWTIKQSTLAAAVVAIIYVISEGASQMLSSGLGKVAGLFAAAVIVFFLAPLQRFADRVAAAAMPNTRNTVEYAMFRKLQVYEAAVAEALQGEVTEKERALLHRLQDSLGISASDAGAIEQELMRLRASPVAAGT